MPAEHRADIGLKVPKVLSPNFTAERLGRELYEAKPVLSWPSSKPCSRSSGIASYWYYIVIVLSGSGSSARQIGYPASRLLCGV